MVLWRPSLQALSAQLAALEAKPQLQGADLQAAEQRICDKAGGGGKMVKVGALRGSLLRVACSGFYVHLKSVFPLIRFLKRVFRELIYRFR